VVARREEDLNEAAIFLWHKREVHCGYGGEARGYMKVVKWRASTLYSKDTQLIPEAIGRYVSTGGLTYPIPPEQRTDEKVKALTSYWLEDGVLSTAPRRDRTLQYYSAGGMEEGWLTPRNSHEW
jgi:hypothetical protein